MTEQENYMAQALALAREAAAAGEVPVGCVIVRGGEIVGRGRNRREEKQSTASHAEMEAIRTGTQKRANPSLAGLSIYASGHPCPMCLAALVMNGAEQVFFAFDNADAQPYGLSSEGTYQRLRLSLSPAPLPITRIDTGITAEQLYGNAAWPQA